MLRKVYIWFRLNLHTFVYVVLEALGVITKNTELLLSTVTFKIKIKILKLLNMFNPFLKIENSVLILEKKAPDFVHFRVKFSICIYTWTCSKKNRKCVKCVIGMWEIDNRLIVSFNKNHETLENIWYFKRRVNTVSTNTPQIFPTNCKFYE